jgi:hypothetical protein
MNTAFLGYQTTGTVPEGCLDCDWLGRNADLDCCPIRAKHSHSRSHLPSSSIFHSALSLALSFALLTAREI